MFDCKAKCSDLCGLCKEKVEEEDRGMGCETCKIWHHIACVKVSTELYDLIMDAEIAQNFKWYCAACCNINNTSTSNETAQVDANETNNSPGQSESESNDENPTNGSQPNTPISTISTASLTPTQCPLEREPDAVVAVASDNSDLHIGIGNSRYQNTNICRKFRIGVCPHGMSGNRVQNETTCPYLHPKVCNRFINYGPFDRRGCRLGKSCKFYHPVICKDSFQDLCCLNKNCQRWHLRDTIFHLDSYHESIHHGKSPVDESMQLSSKFNQNPNQAKLPLSNTSQADNVTCNNTDDSHEAVIKSVKSLNEVVIGPSQQVVSLQHFLWGHSLPQFQPSPNMPNPPPHHPMTTQAQEHALWTHQQPAAQANVLPVCPAPGVSNPVVNQRITMPSHPNTLNPTASQGLTTGLPPQM